MLFSGPPSPPPIPIPPPMANPATMANPQVSQSGNNQRVKAAAAAGAMGDSTIGTSAQGALSQPKLATSALLG